jgi:hypothetical protein
MGVGRVVGLLWPQAAEVELVVALLWPQAAEVALGLSVSLLWSHQPHASPALP